MMKVLFTLLIGCLFVAAIVEANSISVTPAKVIMTITQENNSFDIHVANPGDTDIYVKGAVETMGQDMDGSAVFLGHEHTPYSLAHSLVLEPEEFALPAGETKIVKVSVTNHKEDGGGMYGVIFFSGMPAKSSSSFLSVSRLGVIVLLTFPGSLNRCGEIGDVEVFQSSPDDKMNILTTFYATGNVHIHAGGEITIIDSLKNEIKTVFIQPANILPSYAIQLCGLLDITDLPVGTYTAISRVKYHGLLSEPAQTVFRILRPGVVAQTRGEMVEVIAPTAVLNRVFDMDILFRNTGNVGLQLCTEVEILDSEGKLIDVFIDHYDVDAGKTKNIIIPCIVRGSNICQGTYTANIKFVHHNKKISSATAKVVALEKELIVKGEIIKFVVPTTTLGDMIMPELEFKNTGNVDISVEGMISFQKRDKTVGQMFIEHETISEGQSIRLGGVWKGELPMGIYRATATLIYGNDKMVTAETSFMIVK
ncbi:MAG: hypothetical protein QME49_04330 [bacterium]|nr:hypothetical protein [bacterium]